MVRTREATGAALLMSFVMSFVMSSVVAVTPAAGDETETEVDLGHFGLWPDLSLGDEGVLHLVFTRCATPSGPSGCAVRYRRWDGAWSAEETVPGSDTVSRAETNHARVAVDAGGRVHVAWGPAISGTTSVYYARREADGTWGARVTAAADQVEALDLEVRGDVVFIAANKLAPTETRLYHRAVDGVGPFTTEILGDLGKGITLYRGPSGALLATWWWVSRFVGFRVYVYDGTWSAEIKEENLPEDSPARASLLADAAGARTLAFTAWRRITATEYQPIAVYLREPDGTTIQLSVDPLGGASDPTLGQDASGSRYAVWNDAAGQLRFSNSLWWRPAWIPEGVFPTLTTVEQLTMATGGHDNHLVWRDAAGNLRHNHRLIRDDQAVVVADTIPARMAPGEVVVATILVRNTGNLSWPAAGAWALGALDDADPLAAATRLALDAEVLPGAERELTVTLTAPATPGIYTTDWRMVRDGAYWFGDTLVRAVEVIVPADAGIPDGATPDETGDGAGGCGCAAGGGASRGAASRNGAATLVLALLLLASWRFRARHDHHRRRT